MRGLKQLLLDVVHLMSVIQCLYSVWVKEKTFATPVALVESKDLIGCNLYSIIQDIQPVN